MKVYIGADHGGYQVKERLVEWLLGRGEEVEDVGAEELRAEDDYIDYGVKVAKKVQAEGGRGILLCRNGVGMSVVANRYKGVRCALGFDEEQIRRARRDDDCNCLALAADYIDWEQVKSLVEVFLRTEFGEEERYKRRLGKLELTGE